MVRKGVQLSCTLTLGNRKKSRLSSGAPEGGKLTRKAVLGSMELISSRPWPPMPRNYPASRDASRGIPDPATVPDYFIVGNSRLTGIGALTGDCDLTDSLTDPDLSASSFMRVLGQQ
jgi:hypothetical protein